MIDNFFNERLQRKTISWTKDLIPMGVYERLDDLMKDSLEEDFKNLERLLFFSSTKDSDVKERLIFERLVFLFFNLTILLSNSRWVEVSFNNIWKQITYDGHGTIAKISFVNERHSSRRKTIWVGIQMKSVYISGCRRTNLVLMQIKTYKWHTYFLLKDSTESFFFKKWKTFCLDVQRFLCTLWFWDWKDLGLFVGCM